MILYDEFLGLNLSEFGIDIPLLDQRALSIIEFLSKNFDENKFLVQPSKKLVSADDLMLCHEKKYVDKLFSSEVDREVISTFELIDLNGLYNRYNPQNAKYSLEQLASKIISQTSASFDAMNFSLKTGFSYLLAGGAHHAMTGMGRGFCLVNDIVWGVRTLHKKGIIRSTWIIDVDAHKGDGTAEITFTDSSIVTLSIHMAQGWPLDNPNDSNQPWHIPSNIDLPISSGEEGKYLEKLSSGLNNLKRDFPTPDLVVVVHGSDAYELDELKSSSLISLSLEQLMQRDLLLYNTFLQMDVPQCYLLAGGYGKHSWKVHAQFLEYVLSKRI